MLLEIILNSVFFEQPGKYDLRVSEGKNGTGLKLYLSMKQVITQVSQDLLSTT